MAIFKTFKRKAPGKQLTLDFEKEKKKAQLSFKFLKFLIPGVKKRRPKQDSWYHH